MKYIVVIFALLFAPVGRPALASPGTSADTGGAVFISANTRIAERDRALAMQAAEVRLRAAGWELASKPLSPKEVDAVSTCLHDKVEAWPCVSRVVGSRGIRRVAELALRRDATASGMPELVLTGRLLIADVALVVIGQRFCEQCTDDTLSALTTELTAELLQQAALESGRTVLSIKSTPQGAIYTVDGALKSATDALITIVPGHHVVMIEREGYESETRTIEAVEGKTSEVMVTLHRLEPIAGHSPASTTEPARRSRALPIALVATGGAAVLGGAIALAFNQAEITRPAGQDQPRTHRNTLPAGITALAAGAVVAGVGGYLWWRYSRDDSGRAPVASLVPGGAVVGLVGAF